MHIFHPNLKILMLVIEVVAAIVAIYYFFKLKRSYWKWFSVYLTIVAIQEVFWSFHDTSLGIDKNNYFSYFGVPIQYLFLFWLYASKSLKNKKLYFSCVVIYIAILLLDIFLEINVKFKSINFAVGNAILITLVVLEFLKQIKNDDILQFTENKMFYINVGVILFYIGTYPFFAFYDILVEDYVSIWNMYYLYFLLSNCIMFILFIASFIWGKQRL